jgi:hypothetical protein
MALPATFDKTRKDLEKALSDSTPLLAIVGAGDLAVEKLRKAGAGLNARATELNSRVAKVDAATVRSQAKTRVESFQAALQSRVDAVQGDVKGTPDQVKELQGKAQSKALAAFDATYSTAVSKYDELAGRGKILVTRVRSQQATADLERQAGTTASRAKATATTAKKSAASTKTAAKSASTTAKKQAKATKTSAKATTTAAKKTAEAATTATGDAAAKVGDGPADD